MAEYLQLMTTGHDRGIVPDRSRIDHYSTAHLSFGDFLEACNPLQYVPGVGTIYREVTAESVHPALRIVVAGAVSLLVGGPVGLVVAMVGAAMSEVAQGESVAPPGRWDEAQLAYRRLARAS